MIDGGPLTSNSLASHVTGYLAAALCFGAGFHLVHSLSWRGGICNASLRAPKFFLLFAVLFGLSLLSGSIARHTRYALEMDDSRIGVRWVSENSSWMGAWTVDVVLSPFASVSLGCTVLAATSHPDKIAGWAYVVALICALVEGSLMVAEMLNFTSLVGNLLGVSVCAASSIVLVVYCFARKHDECLALLVGTSCLVAGFGVAFIGHLGCSHRFLDRCPFPVELNLDVVFHSLASFAALFACLGVQRDASARLIAKVKHGASVHALHAMRTDRTHPVISSAAFDHAVELTSRSQ